LLLFGLLGIGLRLTNWLIRRVVERRHVFMRGWEDNQGGAERTESIVRVLTTTARAVFGLLAIVVLLSSLGVNLGAILASVSLISIALGFGAQYLVRDYLSGILILTEDQYRVGDSVEINKISGTVEDMRLRLTVLRDGDGTVHLIPNGEIRVASNRSKEFNKIQQVVSVGYGSNLRDVFDIINRVGHEVAEDPDWQDFILRPLRASRVQDIGEKAIGIRVSGETIPGKGGAVEGEFRLRLLDEFARLGIETAYPKVVAPAPSNVGSLESGSVHDLTDRSTTDDERN
ncbi:MAG: mechanosensitive ion channel, partial [Thermomicrobiales bacterium]|nr:mechanosensitive ion channel [Thermomicrobiales bacterium]